MTWSVDIWLPYAHADTCTCTRTDVFKHLHVHTHNTRVHMHTCKRSVEERGTADACSSPLLLCVLPRLAYLALQPKASCDSSDLLCNLPNRDAVRPWSGLLQEGSLRPLPEPCVDLDNVF